MTYKNDDIQNYIYFTTTYITYRALGLFPMKYIHIYPFFKLLTIYYEPNRTKKYFFIYSVTPLSCNLARKCFYLNSVFGQSTFYLQIILHRR